MSRTVISHVSLTGTLVYPIEVRRSLDDQCLVRGTIDDFAPTLQDRPDADFLWAGPAAEAWAVSRPEPGQRITITGQLTRRSWITTSGATRSTLELLVETITSDKDSTQQANA